MNLLLIPSASRSLRKEGAYGKFFRIFIEEIGSGTYAQMIEVELLDANNIDLLNPGTTIASASSYYYQQAYGADKLIDNQGGESKWTSAGGEQNNSWVKFELPAPVSAKTLTIKTHNNEHERQPKTFQLQVSDDGTAWKTVKRFTNVINWLPNEVRRFDLM